MNTSKFTVMGPNKAFSLSSRKSSHLSYSLLFGQLQMFQEGKISCRHGIAIQQRIMHNSMNWKSRHGKCKIFSMDLWYIKHMYFVFFVLFHFIFIECLVVVVDLIFVFKSNQLISPVRLVCAIEGKERQSILLISRHIETCIVFYLNK